MYQRVEGRVKSIVRQKGFGFIRDMSGGEWFFHKSECQPKGMFDVLNEGDAVEFNMTQSDKGPRAEDVREV